LAIDISLGLGALMAFPNFTFPFLITPPFFPYTPKIALICVINNFSYKLLVQVKKMD